MIKKRNSEYFYSKEFKFFLYALYDRAYPEVSKGLLPTQNKLGGFSYPPHTIDRLDSESNYQKPENIMSFGLIHVIGRQESKTEEVLYSW